MYVRCTALVYSISTGRFDLLTFNKIGSLTFLASSSEINMKREHMQHLIQFNAKCICFPLFLLFLLNILCKCLQNKPCMQFELRRLSGYLPCSFRRVSKHNPSVP